MGRVVYACNWGFIGVCLLYENGRFLIMSLLQEVAKYGLVYCAYNQALISTQNLDNAQKMRLIKALIEDIHESATSALERDL